MKAIVYSRYGAPDVLELRDVEVPIPKDNEVRIKVHASTVTPMDYRFRAGTTFIARLMTGIREPKKSYTILGVELAGEVDAAGKDAELFNEGDQVFAGGLPGTHAEYVCMPESKVARKPTNMTFEEAAAVPFGAVTALRFLRDYGHIQNGHKVVVNGASGGVGTFAVQLAKHFGAEVTGVCGTSNLDMVRSIGADDVIDYTREDFVENTNTYDIVFDAVGKRSFGQCRRSLKNNGVYLSTVATVQLMFQMLRTSIIGAKKAVFTMPPLRQEDLLYLKDLIESGAVKSVIDRQYPLEQAAEAHMYAETGHAKGKIILSIVSGN